MNFENFANPFSQNQMSVSIFQFRNIPQCSVNLKQVKILFSTTDVETTEVS